MFRHIFTQRRFIGAAASMPIPINPKGKIEPILGRLQLNMLQDNPGARTQKRRKGRGIGSGRGKTCGRGHKGQKSRSGGKKNQLFQGGQTPYWKQFPKRGFNNAVNATPHVPINLDTIVTHIQMGRINPQQPITLRSMQLAGIFKPNDVKFGIKLLAKGKEWLDRTKQPPLHVVVNRASTEAIRAIESRGGTVVTQHLNRLGLRVTMRPQKYKDRLVPRLARPKPKFQPYYTSWKKRGYLNPAVQMRSWFQQEGQNSDLEEQFGKLVEDKISKTLNEDSNNEPPLRVGKNAKKTDEW